jgi:AcrR family transcriptional regulator
MQERSNETRNRILSTSFELFSNQGYEGTGVSLICEQAQISKGAFYHHFPSKRDVFLTLIEDWVNEIDEHIQLIKNESTPVPQQLQKMVPELSSIFTEANQIPIFLEFWVQAMRDPLIAKRMVKPYFKFVSLFETMFANGIAEKSIDPDTDPRLSSRLVIALSLGIIMQCMIEPNNEDWQKATQYSLEKVLLGLTKEQK